MKKIQYTPDAAEKLRLINSNIRSVYGKEKAKVIVQSLIKAINGLAINEKKGVLVADMFDIDTDYRYLFAVRNYVFYRIEDDCIRIINIYNEKEDFMWQLFGIDTTSQESLDYWQE